MLMITSRSQTHSPRCTQIAIGCKQNKLIRVQLVSITGFSSQKKTGRISTALDAAFYSYEMDHKRILNKNYAMSIIYTFQRAVFIQFHVSEQNPYLQESQNTTMNSKLTLRLRLFKVGIKSGISEVPEYLCNLGLTISVVRFLLPF